ncbi:MAG: ATP synthase F1 subunit delta [Phaeodactylibacter sp.]|uniref:ATP synthase F1 subunit delta n=1 Tax=Phaeodactylibacter sp. TaxID=1940289 RepID=UPI0032ECE073
MSVQRIASRYAKSLIELAQEQNKLEAVTEDMKTFKTLLSNRDLYLLLKSPVVGTDKKKQIFKILFEGKFDKLTSAFLDILATKVRESYMPEIVDEYLAQYKRFMHISTVKVTTATALDKKAIEAIKAKLLGSKATDDKVEIISVVDPDVIGGFVLEFDDKIYDASLANKLEELKRQFRDNLYVSQLSK